MKTSKNMTNVEIADLLRAVAAAHQLKDEDKQSLASSAGKNRFKIIAYERAADAVEHATSELKDYWDEGRLAEIPGVGKSIEGHLSEIFKSGKSKHFEEIFEDLPPQIFELMEIPGIGIKTAYKLVKNLKVGEKNPFTDLRGEAEKGKIAKLEGFGEDSQKDIIKSLKSFKKREKRYLLPYAQGIAEEVIKWLKESGKVLDAYPLGSLRRKVSTIGDVDIAVCTEKPETILNKFVDYPHKNRVLNKGTESASITVTGGMQVDVKVQGKVAFGSLLQHFTGSKHHNIALREYALKNGYSLSEHGIKNLKTKELKNTRTEEEFYNHLGLDFIEPELREDSGEIKAALEHNLPILIDNSNVKADLQIHSNFDIETSHDLGESTMKELVKKADSLKYDYIAFTEHNPSHSRHSESQIINLLKAKKIAIDQINSSFIKEKYIRIKYVFNSLEIDILPDGSLPVPEKGLEFLDFALVSVHSSFRKGKKEMTKRVLSALSYPKVKIFAHPSGRLLQKREGIELDWEKIFEYCADKNIWFEINGDPMRLDLPDFLVKEAKKYGVKFTFGTDAHNYWGMDNMKYAVSVARRGWLEKRDVVNTRSLEEFKKMLQFKNKD